MVGSVDKLIDARNRNGADCCDDQLYASPIHIGRAGYLAAGLALFVATADADPLRLATFNTELSRKGPGLLLRDITRGEDPQVAAVVKVINAAKADVLALQDIDWDHQNAALSALNKALATPYPHVYASQPNSGIPTGLDMDGDGRTGRGDDAQGYGRFAGQGGMALFSRYPIDKERVTNLSMHLWADIPDAHLPTYPNGKPFPSKAAMDVQRLSSTAHWAIPLIVGDQYLTILTYDATPPVFDGPEDRNGKRNRDEMMVWASFLAGELDLSPPDHPVVLMGSTNLDPADGDGLRYTYQELIKSSGLEDPEPRSDGAALAAKTQGFVNATHRGDSALDTADFRDEGGPGNLRVDFVLPSSDLAVVSAKVLWPDPTLSDRSDLPVEIASRHRLVYVDIDF